MLVGQNSSTLLFLKKSWGKEFVRDDSQFLHKITVTEKNVINALR